MSIAQATFLEKGTARNVPSVPVAESDNVEVGSYYRWTYYVTPSLAAIIPVSVWQEFVDLVFSVRGKFSVSYIDLRDDGTLIVEGQAISGSPLLLLSPLGILAIGAVSGIILSIVGYFALQRVERFVENPLGGSDGGGSSTLLGALSGAGIMLVIVAGLFLYYLVIPRRG